MLHRTFKYVSIGLLVLVTFIAVIRSEFYDSGITPNWHLNLNYHSPSKSHAALGIDVRKVHRRTKVLQRDNDFSAEELEFTHGVASGDPWSDSIILWTRVAPMTKNDESNTTVEGYAPYYNHETAQYIEHSSKRACVEYVVGTDEKLTNVITKGSALTTSDIDFTVKIEVTGLRPYSLYYYQFNICKSIKKSPIGRMKTIPGFHDESDDISFAVFSCSNYPHGYFNAFGNAARKDAVDFFIHLGDYYYEHTMGEPGKDARATEPQHECYTLHDYRTRIAQYRSDEDLRLAHERFSWITTWDDHEVSNNGYRDGSSEMNNTEDSFLQAGRVSVDQRKMNAVRAYFEWMPIRQVDMDDNLRIWRTFSMGSLLDLIVLDTRNYDRSITSLRGWNKDYIYQISNDAGRSLMGSAQENWFYNQLSMSARREATWRIIGNQIIFSRINATSWWGTPERPYSGDDWNGYQANRNRTLDHLYQNSISNTIMLAGDSHNNWASDIAWLDHESYDASTGDGAIGVEFAGTAVSSTGMQMPLADAVEQSSLLVRDNPELQWQEGHFRGYFELHVQPEQVEARYYGCPTVRERTPYEISLANFTVTCGKNRLDRPVAGGSVGSGALRGNKFQPGNTFFNTETKRWESKDLKEFGEMYIQYDN